ncbi:MAG TPA: hypothetical protein VIV40_39375, partial [Kofleriaceae bacterium]
MKRLLACVVALAGCNYLTSSFETNDFSGDPFPIVIDDSSGALFVGVREAGSNADRVAVLDVMSPLTLIDRGPDTPVSIDITDLTVMGARPNGELTLPRAQFTGKQVVTLHPCQAPECSVGTDIFGPRPFNAL